VGRHGLQVRQNLLAYGRLGIQGPMFRRFGPSAAIRQTGGQKEHRGPTGPFTEGRKENWWPGDAVLRGRRLQGKTPIRKQVKAFLKVGRGATARPELRQPAYERTRTQARDQLRIVRRPAPSRRTSQLSRTKHAIDRTFLDGSKLPPYV